MSKINIDGVILDEEQQQALTSHIESLIYSYQRADDEKATQKIILDEKVKGELKLKPAYVSAIAKKIHALNNGTLNASEDQDAEAAKEQIMEIYERLSSNTVSSKKTNP